MWRKNKTRRIATLGVAALGTIVFVPLVLLMFFSSAGQLIDIALERQVHYSPPPSAAFSILALCWAILSTFGLVGFWGWALDGVNAFGSGAVGKRRLILMISAGMLSVTPLLSELEELPSIRVMAALAILGLLGGAYAIADIVRRS